jgi:DNA replication protein DnaC
MNEQSAALVEATVRQQCKALHLPTIGSQFGPLAAEAIKGKQSHTEYLEVLLAAELEEREHRTVERRIREAHLPKVKTLEDFNFSEAPTIPAAQIRELAEGGYIDRAEPVVLTGECGTGKTHLATALCVAACRQRRRVRFTTATGLVNEFVEARQENRVGRLLARWFRYELVAIDEVGYVPLADIGAEFLYQVFRNGPRYLPMPACAKPWWTG